MTTETKERIDTVKESVKAGMTVKEAVKSIGWSVNAYYSALRGVKGKRAYTRRIAKPTFQKTHTVEVDLVRQIVTAKVSADRKIQVLTALVK